MKSVYSYLVFDYVYMILFIVWILVCMYLPSPWPVILCFFSFFFLEFVISMIARFRFKCLLPFRIRVFSSHIHLVCLLFSVLQELLSLILFSAFSSWISALETWTFASENQPVRHSLQTRISFDVLFWGILMHQQIFLSRLPRHFVFR